MKVDIFIYAGAISIDGYELICDRLRVGRQSEKALLVLATPGGDPHAGFRIARAIQHEYGQFDVLVPRYCKSAGTLVALGAKTLFMDDMSELGPLDIQVKKNDEVVGRNSGLDIIQAVNYLQNQTLTAFQTYLVGLTQDVGLSTKVASDISSKLTTGLFEPISAQIDPVRLAEMQRATEVAFEYGSRLASHGRNLRPDGLSKLVNGYPSHGFVIDRKEARNIFTEVKKPSGFLAELSKALRDSTEIHINARKPVVYIAHYELNLDGEADEPQNAPNANAGPASLTPSEPEISGDISRVADAAEPLDAANDGAKSVAGESTDAVA